MQDYYHSVMWFQMALDKYDVAADSDVIQKAIMSTLDYLNFSLFKVSRVDSWLSLATSEFIDVNQLYTSKVTWREL